jgi:hypothetical protein
MRPNVIIETISRMGIIPASRIRMKRVMAYSESVELEGGENADVTTDHPWVICTAYSYIILASVFFAVGRFPPDRRHPGDTVSRWKRFHLIEKIRRCHVSCIMARESCRAFSRRNLREAAGEILVSGAILAISRRVRSGNRR